MEPLDYLRALRQRWVILLAAALLGGAVGWLTAPAGAPTSSSSLRLSGGSYKATQNIMVERQTTGRRNDNGADTTNLPLLAVLATSGEVPLRVVERLGVKASPSAIAGMVKIEADEKLETLRIESTGSNPDEIAAVVNAFSEEILRLAAERNQALRNEALSRAKATANTQEVSLRQLDARLLQLPSSSSESRLVTAERDALLRIYAEQQSVLQDLQSQPPAGPGLVSLGPAVPIPSGSGEMPAGRALQAVDDPRTRAGLGILFGCVLGCALALLVDRVDTRIRSRREAESAFGLPVIAEIPRTRPLSARAPGIGGTFGVDPETFDAYGRLALTVLHSPRWVLSPRPPSIAHDDEEDVAAPVRLVEGPTRIVLVASPGHEDARAVVIANLAASLAASGRSVIAIDCDPERRRLAELLGVRVPEPGPAHAGPARPGPARARPASPGPAHAGPARPVEPDSREAVPGRGGVRPSAVRGVWVAMSASRGAQAEGQLLRSYLEWGDIVLVDAGPILSGGEAGSWAVEADAVLIITAVGRTTAETAALTHEHLARLKARVLGVALVAGVLRTARGRHLGAPSPPPSVQTSLNARPNGEGTAHRLRQGEAVVTGGARRSGTAQTARPQSVPSPTEPREWIGPVLEVLRPEPSAPSPAQPPRPRPHGERTTSDEG